MKKLTAKIIEGLNPKDVIYAEWASPGGMGACGQMTFYIFENNDLVPYSTDIYKHEDDFSAGYNFLIDHEASFCKANGGFGNITYAAADSKLKKDAKHKCLIYIHNNNVYQIKMSVEGVYLRAADQLVELTNFPKSQQTIRLLEKVKSKRLWSEREQSEELVPLYETFSTEWLEAHIEKDVDLSLTNVIFFFLANLEYRPDLKSPIMTPVDWDYAINFIMILNDEAFNFNEEYESRGKIALWQYRLKYAIEKLGFYQFFNLVDNFVLSLEDGADFSLVEKIDKLIGEKLENKFSKIKVKRFKKNQFNYDYPELVKYTDEEDDGIVASIIKREYSDYQTLYYLKNYLHFKDEKSLAKILPVAFYVIAITNDSDIFYAAGDVINSAWALVESEEDERLLQRIIYNAFWERLGQSLWPIDNYERFSFKNSSENAIFEDAVGWLSSLEILEQINPTLNNSVREFEKRKNDTEEKKMWALANELAFVRTIPKAKDVLDKALSGKSEIDPPEMLLEKMLLRPKMKKIGAYVIKRIAEEYQGPAIYDFFTAACEGATERDELPAIKNFAKRMLSEELKAAKIDKLLKLAEARIDTAQFQEKCLRNFTKEFEKCAKLEKKFKSKK